MNAPRWLVLCLLISSSATAQQDSTSPQEVKPRSFRDRLALIEGDPESPFGSLDIETLEGEIERKLTATEREVFAMTDQGEWKTFEDDLIRFEHPSHPLFTVTPVDETNNEPIRVVGGVVSSADNSFERAYHLKVGDIHYGVILVREASWFDEGICRCGPIAFEKFWLEEGTALEFSLLPSGDVKKVQALGAKHRAVLFEWTHSVITQSAYARLGSSLRFKQTSPRSQAEWHALSKQERGVSGLIAWLERGDDASTVRNLLGTPTRTDGENLEFVSEKWLPEGNGYRTTLRVNLKGGAFDRLAPDWEKWVELPPKAGTLAWARARVGHWESDAASAADKKTIMPQELPQVVELFIKNGSHAKDPEWSDWSWIARKVVELGLKDPKVLKIVMERYKEEDLGHAHSNKILEAFEVRERQALFESRAKILLRSEDPNSGGELDDLFAMMRSDGTAFKELLHTSVVHSDENTRHLACNFAERLPRESAIELLQKGLLDATYMIRYIAASNIEKVVTQSDQEWLRAALAKEKDPDVKHLLELAIEAAEKKP